MLNRVIRVLKNKPTEITKPVFTKHFEKENRQIEDLENLLKIYNCNEESRKFIEEDIKKLKCGQIGENNVYYELKNSFVPMICLHNLRLKYKEMVAQIDFLAITSKYIYVIECKNLVGDITINCNGEFIRTIKNPNGKVVSKQGMYSPIVQNERHINVIKAILQDEFKYKNKLKRIESLIVTANPKTILNKTYAPKEIRDKIIRHDQIIDYILSYENNKKIDWVFIEEDMREISNILRKYHKEKTINYEKKYGLSINTNKKDKHHNFSENKHNYNNKEKVFEKRKRKSDDELKRLLKKYRLKTSEKENLKPYMVFNDDTMEEIIETRPKSLYELRNIKGMGKVKCDKYGRDLISIIV